MVVGPPGVLLEGQGLLQQALQGVAAGLLAHAAHMAAQRGPQRLAGVLVLAEAGRVEQIQQAIQAHLSGSPIAPRERPSRSRRSAPVDITPIVCAPVGSGRGEMRLHLMAPDGWNFTNQNSIQLRFRVVHREDLIELAEQRSILPDDAPELVVATTVITRPADAPHARGQLQIDVDAVLVAIGNRSTWAPARGSYRLEVALTGDAPCDLDVRLPVELIAR